VVGRRKAADGSCRYRRGWLLVEKAADKGERRDVPFAVCLGLCVMSLFVALAIMDHVRNRPLELVFSDNLSGALDEIERIEILSPPLEVRQGWLPSFFFLLAPVFLYLALIFRQRRVSLRTAMLLTFAGATLAAIPNVTGRKGDEHFVRLYGGGFAMGDVSVEQELNVEKILSALPTDCWQMLEIGPADLRVVDWNVETQVMGRIRVWLAPKLDAAERMLVLRACAFALHEAASWVPESRAQRQAQRDVEIPRLFSAALGNSPEVLEWAQVRAELVTLRSHLNSQALTIPARQSLTGSIQILEAREEELFERFTRGL